MLRRYWFHRTGSNVFSGVGGIIANAQQQAGFEKNPIFRCARPRRSDLVQK